MAPILAALPAPGEALHVLMAAQYNLSDVVGGILAERGRCSSLLISTLSFNEASIDAIKGWVDAGLVGAVGLAASFYFRVHNKDLCILTKAQFVERGWPIAFSQNHAKVVCLALDCGERIVIEGSANWRELRNLEQMTIINDQSVYEFHSGWITHHLERHQND